MQRIVHVAALATLLAVPASAGLTYEFTSTTSGMSNQIISGTVQSEGDRMRVDIGTGDGVLFQNGSYIVSSNGAQTMTVVDPRGKTFYDLDLSQVFGGAEGLLAQFGDDVKIDVSDPRVTVSAATDGGTLEGYKAKKSVIEAAYNLSIKAFGQPITVRIEMDSNVWWTDQLSASATNFLQMRGLRTGVDAVDKLMAAQGNAISGFPLKQTTTTRISLGGNEMQSTTTSTVRNVKQTSVAPAAFTVPAGFTKTANPVEKMFAARPRS